MSFFFFFFLFSKTQNPKQENDRNCKVEYRRTHTPLSKREAFTILLPFLQKYIVLCISVTPTQKVKKFNGGFDGHRNTDRRFADR